MRLNKPQEFDPNREYKPGERCTYNGKVIIAEIWTKSQNINQNILRHRCARCQIKNSDCPALVLHCFKTQRTDNKTIYWRFLRYQNK